MVKLLAVMKKPLLLVLVFCFVFTSVGFVFAADPATQPTTPTGSSTGSKIPTGVKIWFQLTGVGLLYSSITGDWFIKLDVGKRTALGIFTILFDIIGTATLAFASLASVILQAVLSPGFTSLSYTGRSNPVIDAGLGITMPLVNMILVLVLVFIALATILKLAGYEIKKLLPTFILVALLVNFAPVICGLVVDASNIVMNYFAQGLYQFADFTTQLGLVWKGLGAIVKGTMQQAIEAFFYSLVVSVFAFFLALAFFLFAAIFIFRYIAIWVLVILSPLAFACYILPSTRNLWKQWWNQFLQWSFIGVTAGFFLYLATLLITRVKDYFTTTTTGLPPGMDILLIYLVPLAFLYVGLAIGFSSSAFGASMVMDLTKKYGGKLGKTLWKGARDWGEERTRFREGVGKAVQAVEHIPLARSLLPEGVRKYAQFRPAIDEAQKAAAFQSSPELAHRMATGADYGVRAVGNLMEIIGRGDSQDIFKAFREKHGAGSDAELYENAEFRSQMARYLQIALQGGHHNTILRSSPRLARFAYGSMPGYSKTELEGAGFAGSPEGAVAKAVSEARSQHIKNWEKEELQDEAVVNAGLSRGRDFWQSASSQVKGGHEEPIKTISKMFARDYLKKGMSDKQVNEAWEKFHEDTKTKYNGQDGFFQFIGSQRAKEQGWTPDRIKELATGKKWGPSTPGEAAGINQK